MEELISVIVNVYNGEKFIGKCLDCIINQTYRNIEVLIINDGSTDKTIKICENYKDDRIKIINVEKMGLSRARNIGIENAKGDYLYFMDVDDVVELDVLEYLLNLCKNNNVEVATCKSMDIYDYNYKVKNKGEKIEILSNIEMLKRILLLDRMGTVWNKLIKKYIFNDIRFENRIINDVTVTHKIIMAATKVAYSNQIKYYYLKHKESITWNSSIERDIDLYNALMERYNYIDKVYENLLENRIRVMQTISYLYLKENSDLNKYLNENGALKSLKKMFTLKILFCHIKFGEKIKIILFAISPKLCSILYRQYFKLAKKNKEVII